MAHREAPYSKTVTAEPTTIEHDDIHQSAAALWKSRGTDGTPQMFVFTSDSLVVNDMTYGCVSRCLDQTRRAFSCSESAQSAAASQDASCPYGIPAAHHSDERIPGLHYDSAAPSDCHSGDPIPDRQAVSSHRVADYGQWKLLGEDSSDAEMEDGHPSSRESSVARNLPPQRSLSPIPDLSFLPRSYDTSDLLSQQSSVPAPGPSRSDSRTECNLSHNERERSTPRPVSPSSLQTSYQAPNQGPIPSSTRTGAERNPQPRRTSRRKLSRHVQSSDLSEDDSDGGAWNKVQKPTAAPPQSSVASRNLRRDRSSGITSAAQNIRGPPRLARRSVSESSRTTDSSSDEQSEDDQALAPATASGHTVVIPKRKYARGRRLLAPANPDRPFTTILMRGEAHFVDQRRKCVATPCFIFRC